jgi:N utilization substance protein B
VLYAWELRGAEQPPVEVEEELAGADEARRAPEVRTYARELLEFVHRHRPEIDARIQGLAANWRLSRMTTVDRNILRIAAAEMLYSDDVPLRVSLHEAIRLAEWFGTGESSRFINGVLDALLHELEPEGQPDAR